MGLVAHFGTFDVENFGDLLFPAIIERRLADLGHTFVHVSPLGGLPVWGDCVPTVSVDAFIEAPPQDLAAVVVGGGHIIHASPTSLPRYEQGGLSAILAYPQLWLGAAVLAAQHNVPYCWNAPGVAQPFSPAGSRLVEWTSAIADYFAVRDHTSRARLRDAGVTRPIRVVPDTALETARLWTQAELDEAFQDAFISRGREAPGRVIVIHLNRRYVNESPTLLAARLDRVARHLQATPILIATGPCHGDDELQREVGVLMESVPLIIDRPRSLREVAACLARAQAYFGSSLHGMIVSCSFGTPAMVIVPPTAGAISKFLGFLDPLQLSRWISTSWEAAEQRLDEFGAAPRDPWTRVLDATSPILDEHWQHLRIALDQQPAAQQGTGIAVDKPGALERLVRLSGAADQRAMFYAPLVAEQAVHSNQLQHTASAERRAKETALTEQRQLRSNLDTLQVAREESREMVKEMERQSDALRMDLAQSAVKLQAQIASAQEAADKEHRAKEQALNERDRLRSALERELVQREELRAEVAALQLSAKSDLEALRGYDQLLAETAAFHAQAELALRAQDTLLQDRDRVITETISERDHLQNALAIACGELLTAVTTAQDTASKERSQKEQALTEQERLRALNSLLAAELEKLRAVHKREQMAAGQARLSLDQTYADSERQRKELQSNLDAAQLRMDETAHALSVAARQTALIAMVIERAGGGLSAKGKPGKAASELAIAQQELARLRDNLDKLVRSSKRSLTSASDLPTSDLDQIRPAAPAPVRTSLFEHVVPSCAAEHALGSNSRTHVADLKQIVAPVDIVICVHNAPADVQRCLQSVVRHTPAPHRLIIVDDGSGAETAAWLQSFTHTCPHATLLRNEHPSGYAKAANQGLRAATGEVMVLLNSDTIVTPYWLEHLLACLHSDPQIGIVGPLSNAASYQSVPERFDPSGDWALNPIPPGWDIDGIAAAVARISNRSYPRVPFVNGFCFAISRAVIEAIGYFDEEGFPDGYGEENDFCLRAADAGFGPAIADQAYLYHAKSRSYSHERRRELGKAGRAVLLSKHSQKRLEVAEVQLRDEPHLATMRSALAAYLQADAPGNGMQGLSVLFLLPVGGGGGGAHSVVQEASGMRRLGINAQVAIQAQHLERYRANYPDISERERLFFAYRTLEELQAHAARFSVVVGTIHTSIPLLAEFAAHHPNVLPAYYIQDYEPFFYPEGSPGRKEAARSYTLIPQALLFAKTRWLCDTVGALHNVTVHKVRPSLDHGVYCPPAEPRQDGPVRVAAMIRPSSPRRGAGRTMATLRRLRRKLGKRVVIKIFGCTDIDLAAAGLPLDFPHTNLGVLPREGVAAALRDSDIFLDLSDYQAFGRAGLEAMACGCAVVLPALGGATEYAVHGENALLVDTSNVDICFEAVNALVKHHAARDQLRNAGSATAASYSIDLAAASEVNLFAKEWSNWANSRPNNVRVTDTSAIIAASSNVTTSGKAANGLLEARSNESLRGAIPLIASTKLGDPRSAAITEWHPNLVTVVVPVFNAFDEVKTCLSCLVRHGTHPYQVLLIDDASTDARVWPLLQSYSAINSNFSVLRNEHNLGYTATINRACRLVPGDVILLNSDTQVTNNWIEKLAACAASHPNVATVTALSNAAGAFSVPINGEENSLPNHLTVDNMAKVVESLSTALRPSVPTGNGFCIYITRRALEAVGYFDEKNFPFGYGEENDFCMRATAKGFHHLVDDSTYIYHSRSASFGSRKSELTRQNRARLEQLHPSYKGLVTAWQKADPLDGFRAVLREAVQRPFAPRPADTKPCILYVLHDGDGGSVHTSNDLIQKLAPHFRCLVLKTGLDSWTLFEHVQDCLVPIRRYNFRQSWQVQLHQYEERRQVIIDICSTFEVSIAHIRHLLANEPELIKVLKAMHIAVVFSFHDYYTVCPTIHLIDDKGAFCGGTCTAGAGVCNMSKKWFRGEVPIVKHAFVHEHRMSMGESLTLCDRYITTSRAAQKVLANAFPFLESPAFRVIEHGRDLDRVELAARPGKDGRPRVVCFGALGEEKGIALLQSIMRLDSERGSKFEFHLLGRLPRGIDPDRFGAVYHGPYNREDLTKKLADFAPSFAIIPSIASETYCHTLTEAWAAGLPVFASKIGALQERIEKHGGGWLLDNSDPEAFYNGMVAVLGDTAEYQRQIEAIRQIPMRSLDDMAEDYLSVYQELLPTSKASHQSLSPASAGVPNDIAERGERPISLYAATSMTLSQDEPLEHSEKTHIQPREVKLDDLVAMIERHEVFSLSRWGDGEWFTVFGRTDGRTRGGQKFRADVGAELRRVLSNRPPYLMELVSWERTFGSQVHEWLIEQGLDDLDWINPNILHRASMSGWLGDAICALRSRAAWVVVGPEHLLSAQEIFGFTDLIPIPEDCFPQKAMVLERVLQTASKLPRSAVITFSAGMTAKILLDDVFQRFGDQLALIDSGSLWDPYAGVFSRSYMDKDIFKQRLEVEKQRQLRIMASLKSRQSTSTNALNNSA